MALPNPIIREGDIEVIEPDNPYTRFIGENPYAVQQTYSDSTQPGPPRMYETIYPRPNSEDERNRTYAAERQHLLDSMRAAHRTAEQYNSDSLRAVHRTMDQRYEEQLNRYRDSVPPPDTAPYSEWAIATDEREQARRNTAYYRQATYDSDWSRMLRGESSREGSRSTKVIPTPDTVHSLARSILEGNLSSQDIVLKCLKAQEPELHKLVIAEIVKLRQEQTPKPDAPERKIELSL